MSLSSRGPPRSGVPVGSSSVPNLSPRSILHTDSFPQLHGGTGPYVVGPSGSVPLSLSPSDSAISSSTYAIAAPPIETVLPFGSATFGSATYALGSSGTTPPVAASPPVTVPLFAQRPRSPSPPQRVQSPSLQNVPSSLQGGYVNVTRAVHVGNGLDTNKINGSLQSLFGGVQTQIQEFSMALMEERRSRQQMELHLEGQLQGLIPQVIACKDVCASTESAVLQLQGVTKELMTCKERLAQSELALADERRERQQVLAELAEERVQRQNMDAHLTAQLQALMAEINTLKGRLDGIEHPPEDPVKIAVQTIERRGHVRVNFDTGNVKLLSPLDFKPRTTRDEPTAELKDVPMADAICYDLAELSKIFSCKMVIEGHTKGGDSEFWQTLADARSHLISEKVIQFGANPSLLVTKGLPGKRGKNQVTTEIYMDILQRPMA